MTPSQRALAIHLWWRYTWRVFLFMFPITLVAGILIATAIALQTEIHGPLWVFSIVMVALAATAASVFVMGLVIRGKPFLKLFHHDGKALQPFVTVQGHPTSVMPWSSAYGILWGIGWRAWLLGTLVQIMLRLTLSGHPGFLLLALLISGQVATILAMAWLIAKPIGKTRIEIEVSTI